MSGAITEARRALKALRLEVPAAVADDVSRLVEAAFEEARVEAEGLRTVIAVRYARMERLMAMNDDLRAEADRLRAGLGGRVDALANFRECFTDPHDFDIEIAELRAILGTAS